MKCPYCGFLKDKVIDSRPVDGEASVRRRRECLDCHRRFTTFETVESSQIIVIKKSGQKEVFDRQKLLGGVLKATQKRPVDAAALVAEIEAELQNAAKREVASEELGEMVMDRLKALDEVSYVRFASVYREFKDIDTFLEALNALKSPRKSPEQK